MYSTVDFNPEAPSKTKVGKLTEFSVFVVDGVYYILILITNESVEALSEQTGKFVNFPLDYEVIPLAQLRSAPN